MKFLFFLVFVFFYNIVYAEEISNTSQIYQFSQNLVEVSADFVQSKKMPNIKKEFISKGKVQFKKHNGLFWQQDTPTKYTFKSTQNKFCYNNETKDTNSLPYFQEIFGIIEDVLALNFSSLEKIFHVSYSENKQKWFLTLTPTIDKIEKFLLGIELIGDKKEISKITLKYVSGMVIILEFTENKEGIINEISCP